MSFLLGVRVRAKLKLRLRYRRRPIHTEACFQAESHVWGSAQAYAQGGGRGSCRDRGRVRVRVRVVGVVSGSFRLCGPPQIGPNAYVATGCVDNDSERVGPKVYNCNPDPSPDPNPNSPHSETRSSLRHTSERSVAATS